MSFQVPPDVLIKNGKEHVVCELRYITGKGGGQSRAARAPENDLHRACSQIEGLTSVAIFDSSIWEDDRDIPFDNGMLSCSSVTFVNLVNTCL